MRIRGTTAIALLAVGLFAASSHALTITGGTVDGWGVTPFSGSPVTGVISFDGNDTAPINYPHVGYVPSPGGNTGERFDLEEMHVRRNAGKVELLVVASSHYQASAGRTFNLGDLLIDTNADGAYDFGVVTQSSNTGLTAGGLYDVDTLARLQNKPGSYRGHYKESEIGPWAVASGSMLSQAAIETAMWNYGGKENGTWIYQYAFNEADLGGWSFLDFHLVWGCGNDVMEGRVDTFPPNDNGVPEPMTAALGLMALGAIGSVATRRRRG